MSHFDGDVNEMPISPLDDRALEALQNRTNSVPADLQWLSPFVEDLDSAANGPAPVLRPALATMLAEGFSIEKGDLPATAASNVTGPAPQVAGLPKWRRKMLVSELLAGITAKVAGLGMAAKAGMGLTLAAASVGTAGAVGVLPDPVQGAVAGAVSAATPFTFPESADDHANFGSTVSTDATGSADDTPGVDGQVVSDAAKNKEHPSGEGVGANDGATGLDRANQTPAAGHAPTSLPNGAPSDPGSQSSNGIDEAIDTPAAGHIPPSVPAGAPDDPGSQGSTGIDTAGETPAGASIPAHAPGRP